MYTYIHVKIVNDMIHVIQDDIVYCMYYYIVHVFMYICISTCTSLTIVHVSMMMMTQGCVYTLYIRMYM